MTIVRRLALLALLVLSAFHVMAGYVPRWESTYDPGSELTQRTHAARLLADGTMMVVGEDSWTRTAIRFDTNGTVLTKATLHVPNHPWAYQISPFGEIFILGWGFVMKYDGITGAAAWAAPAPLNAGGYIVSSLTLDWAGNPIAGWDLGNTRYVRKLNGVDGSTIWTHSMTLSAGVVTRGITTDANGDVLVVTMTGLGGNNNFLTTKLAAATGAELWSATYDRSNEDRPLFINADYAGNVYVVGTTLGTGTDIAIVKYAGASGAELWRTTSAGPAASSDTPTAVVVDAENSLFIGGTYQNGTYTDAQYMKFSASGTRILYTTVAGVRDDVVNSIAVDGAGDLFATGSAGGTVGTDLTIRKLSGKTLLTSWSQSYDRTQYQDDAGIVVEVSANGDALVAGTTYDSVQREDMSFLKYSGSSGTRTALTHVNGNNTYSHFSRLLAVGPSNTLYAEGSAIDVQKFDANTGAGLSYESGTTHTAAAMAFDSAGNRYTFRSTTTSSPDMTLTKYNAAGALQWQRTWNGPTGQSDRAVAMTVDSADNPIVTGTSYSAAAGSAIVTIKYNSAGTQQWIHTFNGTVSNGTDEPVAIVTDASNNVFVAGTAYNTGTYNDILVLKIDGATGVQAWTTSLDAGPSGFHDDVAVALALDASGNPVVAGRYDNVAASDFAAIKLNGATGTTVWNTRITNAVREEPRALAIDGAGDVILCGTTNVGAGAGDIQTIKLSGTTGAQSWIATSDGGNGADAGVAVRVTSTNEIVVLGTVVSPTPRWEDLAVIRYTTAGAIATGPVLYDSGAQDFAEAMVMIGDEPVILGRNGDRFLIVRYTEALGMETLKLPPAYCGLPYSATVTAANGTPPYTFTVTSGLLPPGVGLDPSSGAITGTATITGAPFTVRIRVTDSTSAYVERDFRIEGFPGSPYAPMTATSNPVCGSVTLSPAGSWSSYLWQPNGQTTPNITTTLSQPTLFGVRLGDSSSCITRAAQRLGALQPLSYANISVSGTATLCNTPTGGTANVYPIAGGTTTHQWGYRITPGGAITDFAGKTATSYLITASDFPGAGTYYLVCRTTPYCGAPLTSNEVTVTITTFTAPTALTATATADNQIDLTWAASTGSGLHHYNIYRSSGFCPGGTFTKIGEATGPSYTDTTVIAGGVYSYKVTAVGSGNICESAFTNCDDAVAYGSCNLAPSFTGATSATANGCFLRVTWSPATSNCPLSPNVVYNVHRSTTSGFTPSPANRIASCVTNTSYDDDAVTTGTTYYYIVRAEDSSTGGAGPCNGGNEDTNVTRVSAMPGGGSGIVTTLYADSFEAPNRPATSPDAYWIEQAQAGADHLSLSTCKSSSTNTSYKWGNTVSCPGSYATNLQSNLTHGGNGSVSGSINGFALPTNLSNLRLKFKHYYVTESAYDGVALYYSTTGAAGTFTLVNDSVTAGKPYITTGVYNRALYIDGGHRAWTGSQPSWTQVVVNLDNIAGQTVWFRWRMVSDSSVSGEGYYLDDVTITGETPVSCGAATAPVQALTARSADGTNLVEWLNPTGTYGSTMIRFRTDAFPTTIADGTLGTTQTGTAGARDSWTHSGLTNNTTYYYAAFVDDGAGNWSRRRTVAARPQLVSGPVKWVYATGASAVTPPGVGSVFAVANDRMAHGINGGTSGGQWPASWKPAALTARSLARPAIANFTLGTATKEVYVGSLDGHVSCLDGDTGAQIWKTASPIGDAIHGATNGTFISTGGTYDLTLAGTRNASAGNQMIALDATTGATAWTFDNGGGSSAIGVITGDAAVDSANNRVFFASRAKTGGSNHTIWALSFTGTSATNLWSTAIGDSDASPTVANSRVYAGTINGTVYALDQSTGAIVWSYATNDGPVKGAVSIDATTGRLYFATTNRIWSITDAGTTAAANWSVALSRPSVSVYTGSAVIVGSGDGRLYQFTNLTNTTPTQTFAVLGAGTAAVSSASYDSANAMIYAGSDAGAIYAVSLPLP